MTHDNPQEMNPNDVEPPQSLQRKPSVVKTLKKILFWSVFLPMFLPIIVEFVIVLGIGSVITLLVAVMFPTP